MHCIVRRTCRSVRKSLCVPRLPMVNTGWCCSTANTSSQGHWAVHRAVLAQIHWEQPNARLRTTSGEHSAHCEPTCTIRRVSGAVPALRSATSLSCRPRDGLYRSSVFVRLTTRNLPFVMPNCGAAGSGSTVRSARPSRTHSFIGHLLKISAWMMS